MGTIIFVILRLINWINTPFDYPIICFLISLDSIAAGAMKSCKCK